MIPKDEQEITITAMRTEDYAYLYCSDTTWITKMEKLRAKNPDDFTIHSEDTFGRIYRFPKRLITIRSKIQKCDLSDERREALRERMRKISTSTTDSSLGNGE